MFENTDVRIVTSNLNFPEGPVVGPGGAVFVCEVDGGALVRVDDHDGTRTVVAPIGRGANGAAFGPDGAIYVGSSGGFVYAETGEGTRGPIALSDDNEGGFIHRVDPVTGEFEQLFTHCDGERLRSLNDIVFDANGGAYIADTQSAIYYFDPLARTIAVAASSAGGPNGLGLSPDGTRLYESETFSGRVRVWDVVGAGKLVELPDLFQHANFGEEGAWFWDGLAVDGAGNVVVADLLAAGVRVISPEGTDLGLLPVPLHDPSVTCLCFGGADGNTIYITSGGRGTLYAAQWPWPGLRLNFQP